MFLGWVGKSEIQVEIIDRISFNSGKACIES